ncbi:Sensor histidine kinase YehU [compost metagenome]
MLKAKLNPHFLYNTLDSINWLARINGQAAISDMIKALGDLLRASINSKEMNTLGEELEIIRKYIAIQQFRFEDRLVCRIEVDEQWLDLPVPSMILQPIVENCIKYGVDARTGICRIHIGAKQGDQKLFVTIKDHGSGETDPASAGNPSGGFGLTSINERLLLLYGEAFGVTLLEDVDGGTTVQLTVPVPVYKEGYPCQRR